MFSQFLPSHPSIAGRLPPNDPLLRHPVLRSCASLSLCKLMLLGPHRATGHRTMARNPRSVCKEVWGRHNTVRGAMTKDNPIPIYPIPISADPCGGVMVYLCFPQPQSEVGRRATIPLVCSLRLVCYNGASILPELPHTQVTSPPFSP